MGKTPEFDIRDSRINLAINGAMDIWQRVAGNSVAFGASTAEFLADRFYHYTAGPTAKSFTMQRSTVVPSAAQVVIPPPYSVQVTCNTTVPVLNTIDRLFAYRYVVEDKDMLEAIALGYITFAFEFMSTTAGTYPCRLYNFLTNRSYVSTFSYTTPGVYQQIIVQFPVEASTGHLGFYIEQSGATHQTASLNSWLSGDFGTPTGTGFVHLFTSGLVMRMTNFSVFAGRVRPDRDGYFRRTQSFEQELSLCQRYYEKSYDLETVPGTITNTGSIRLQSGPNSIWRWNISFKVRKRTTIGGTLYANNSATPNRVNIGGAVVTPSNVTSGEANVSWEAGGAANADSFYHYTADAEI